jgi:hypothetical protein
MFGVDTYLAEWSVLKVYAIPYIMVQQYTLCLSFEGVLCLCSFSESQIPRTRDTGLLGISFGSAQLRVKIGLGKSSSLNPGLGFQTTCCRGGPVIT